MDTPLITLKRFAYTPVGVFGHLFAGELSLFCVERQWRQNRQNISCIPEGLYPLRKRRSGVVERSTAGEFQEGWEVCSVTGRSFIMIHPGNTELDLEGCLSPGVALGYVADRWAVTDSRTAFRSLMSELENHTEWNLHITHFHPTMREEYVHA